MWVSEGQGQAVGIMHQTLWGVLVEVDTLGGGLEIQGVMVTIWYA